MPVISDSAQLWMRGQSSSVASMPLTITGKAYYTAGRTLPLSISGNTPGFKWDFNALPLTITGEAFAAKLNLFIEGDDGINIPDNVSYLNLVLFGEGYKEHNNVNLVIWGSNASYDLSYNTLTLEQLFALTLDQYNLLPLDTSDIFTGYNIGKMLTLYITGEGLYENFIPHRSNINLYLQGGTGSERPLLLFIEGGTPGGHTVDLYMAGIEGFIEKNLDLYMSSRDEFFKQLHLFIRGYNA